MNQCRTEIFRLPGEFRRGLGVRVVAVAEHRDIDEVSRRGILPDLAVGVRQIDPLSIQRPTRSSPTSKIFGRAIGCGHAIAVRSTRSWRKADSNLWYRGEQRGRVDSPQRPCALDAAPDALIIADGNIECVQIGRAHV